MNEEFVSPFDMRLEEHVIGCIVLDPNCVEELHEIGFRSEHFYHRGNEKFCSHLFELWRDDPKKIDIALIAPKLTEFGYTLERVLDVVHSIPTAANVAYYADQIKTLAVLRYAMKVGQRLLDARSLRDPDEIREVIQKAEGLISRLGETQVKLDTLRPIQEVLKSAHERLEKAYYDTSLSGISGLSTGFEDLDKMTAGLQNSDLIIIAARPSMGKTAIALNLAQNISLKIGKSGIAEAGEPGAFFSLEMSGEQLTNRMLSSLSRIDQHNLTSGLLLDDDWSQYTMAVSQLSAANLVIDDGAGLTITEIKTKARKIRRERGLKYIIIDYLGKVRGERGQSRYDVVSENVRELKNMAKELNIPVIVLCQLSRGVEQRQDKRPIMSDLRESGEIEQEADIIMFLYRDDYYIKNSDKKNITEIIIAKHRNGPIGTIELAFMKKYGKFVDLYKGGRTVGEQSGAQVGAAI